MMSIVICLPRMKFLPISFGAIYSNVALQNANIRRKPTILGLPHQMVLWMGWWLQYYFILLYILSQGAHLPFSFLIKLTANWLICMNSTASDHRIQTIAILAQGLQKKKYLVYRNSWAETSTWNIPGLIPAAFWFLLKRIPDNIFWWFDNHRRPYNQYAVCRDKTSNYTFWKVGRDCKKIGFPMDA